MTRTVCQVRHNRRSLDWNKIALVCVFSEIGRRWQGAKGSCETASATKRAGLGSTGTMPTTNAKRAKMSITNFDRTSSAPDGCAMGLAGARMVHSSNSLCTAAFDASSLSDLKVKSLISLQFVFSAPKENCKDIKALAVRGGPSPTGC